LTLLLEVSAEVSARRLLVRQATMPFLRDRIEEADAAFFERVARGYEAIAAAEPGRVKRIEAGRGAQEVAEDVWRAVQGLVGKKG
jgi:dTMP kinase